MKNYLVPIAVMLCVAACSDKDKDGDELILCDKRIVVVDTQDINCGLPMVRFRDTSVIRTLTGHPSWELCVVDGLPERYRVIGQQLIVCARKLRRNEERMCLTMGPVYPVVKITSTKEQ
jgi:hypothetical protein